MITEKMFEAYPAKEVNSIKAELQYKMQKLESEIQEVKAELREIKMQLKKEIPSVLTPLMQYVVIDED